MSLKIEKYLKYPKRREESLKKCFQDVKYFLNAFTILNIYIIYYKKYKIK